MPDHRAVTAIFSMCLCVSRGADACWLERARLHPRYGGLTYTIGPREISLRNAFGKALDNLLALVNG